MYASSASVRQRVVQGVQVEQGGFNIVMIRLRVRKGRPELVDGSRKLSDSLVCRFIHWDSPGGKKVFIPVTACQGKTGSPDSVRRHCVLRLQVCQTIPHARRDGFHLGHAAQQPITLSLRPLALPLRTSVRYPEHSLFDASTLLFREMRKNRADEITRRVAGLVSIQDCRAPGQLTQEHPSRHRELGAHLKQTT